MFRLATFKICAMIKTVYYFNWLPFTYTRSGYREMFLEINLNQETLKLYTSREPVQIDYKKARSVIEQA